MKQIKKNVQLPTLLKVFDEDNEQFRLRVGKDRSIHSYKIMVRARKYVADYLQSWEQREDIPLQELQLEILQRFSVYLSVERNLHRGTIWLNCMMLKGVVQRAYKRGLIPVSPFAEFHIPKNIGEREFLSEEEVQRLIAHRFEKPLDAYVRDIFVFSALTGMSFVDIRQLQKSEIVVIDSHQWILSERKKTGIPFRVRLMEQPLVIIQRYQSDGRELSYGHALSISIYPSTVLAILSLLWHSIMGCPSRVSVASWGTPISLPRRYMPRLR